MFSEPLARNPLKTRDDLAAAMRELWRPFRPLLERQGAAITLEVNEATYGAPGSMVETFVRPLWGIAALVAGGGDFPDGGLCRAVLAEGVDPTSPRYWGDVGDYDQRSVEMGSLAAALWIAPELLWTPLSAGTRRQVVAWLRQIDGKGLYDNNWKFFRVLVHGALRSLGEPVDHRESEADLARLDSFFRGDGWYADGPTEHFDYYIPMAMHLYGMLYATLSPPGSPHAADFLGRARRFAPDFVAWFAPGGAALPLGRSLTYRFAQGAFWGGLAFAGVEALPWGVIKGLHLRHLRWWLRQPIFTETGLLSVGYAYPNQIMAEGYNAPGSPYWAAKAFLPLALPATHPFWTAEELPCAVPEISIPTGRPGLVIGRDAARDHVFALANNPLHRAAHRHFVQKYSKFAYSTAFAFEVPVGGNGPRHGGGDSMLLLTADERDWRAREEFETLPATGAVLHSRWRPWSDVEIETWLTPAMPGHLRVHRVRTPRALKCFEGGFPLAKQPTMKAIVADAHSALTDNGMALSALWDLGGNRAGRVIAPEPNTNLLHPLTRLPALIADLPAGETWLFAAVAGFPGANQENTARAWAAEFRLERGAVPILWRGLERLLECKPEEKSA